MQFHIELGDGGQYETRGVDTVNFHKELGNPLHLKDVMFVPRMKKISIFVVVLEDRGYDVIFSKGKSFLRHIATR